MNIRQLEMFSAVMTTGSLTAAARVAGCSPSAATRLVQDLEQRLGFALFDRNGPRVTPTGHALAFHDEVERSLAGLRQIEQRAEAIGRGEARPIEIAAIPALAAGLVPAALALAGTGLPKEVGVTAMPAGEVVGALLDRRADIGFASLPIEYRGLDVHWLGEAPCVAVLPAGHPLAQTPQLALKHLDGQRLITVADLGRLRQRIDGALRAAGAHAAGLIVANAAINAVLMARAGLGIALVDPVTALGAPFAGLVQRPIDAHIPFYWGVVTPSGRGLRPEVAALIEHAAAAAGAVPGFQRHGSEAIGSILSHAAAQEAP